tara:strand:- start:63149 stop:64147 length:999 start_codon:yes stop_codon:yes gene_type:complete
MILDKILIKYFLLILSIFFFTCSKKSNKTIISGNTMGTTYSVTIIDFVHNKDNFQSSINNQLKSVNQKFSTYINNSEISLINRAGTEIITISNEFKYVLNKALYYCMLVKGNYDITVGPLVDLWGFKTPPKKMPSYDEIVSVLNYVGYEKIYLNNNYLVKGNKNINIDLNSIAKGYAVDQISEFLNEKGYSNYLVEIGGELRSQKDDSYDDWIVGIQNPVSNSIIKKIKLNNLSLATSGTYNNFFELEGVTYSHILNPNTGYPYRYQTVSTTVLAEKCIDADAYATLSMTMEPDDIIDLVNQKNDVEAYIIEVDKNNKIVEYMSEGFKKIIY